MRDIPLEAKVECADGPCGKSVTVIINPVTQEVTHFVTLDTSARHPVQRLVPMDTVAETSRDRIMLTCTKAELAEMEPFIGTRYVAHGMAERGYKGYQAVHMPVTTAEDTYYTEEPVERIPEGELAVHRGTKVEASDGHVGSVGEFLIDPESGHITHLILMEGHLWAKKEVTVPISAIDHVEGDTVHLSLDKKAIAELPVVPVKRHYTKDQ